MGTKLASSILEIYSIDYVLVSAGTQYCLGLYVKSIFNHTYKKNTKQFINISRESHSSRCNWYNRPKWSMCSYRCVCTGNSINNVRWRKSIVTTLDSTRRQKRGTSLPECRPKHICVYPVPNHIFVYHGYFVRRLGRQVRQDRGLLDLQFA